MKIMVEEIDKVVTEYEQRLCRSPFALRLSYGRRMLAEDGGPNPMFFTVLLWNETIASRMSVCFGLRCSVTPAVVC